jgi:membrane protein DedA with SNARE-associated domain/membrane-associated phospholipid phosphatase
MLDRLVNLVSNLGHWGYLVIFLVVSLESAAFLGFFMPGETVVLLGGFLASQGVLDLKTLIVVVAVAAVFGDSVGYELGRRLGRDWLVAVGGRLGLKASHWQQIDRFFDRHGGKTVFFARFSYLFRVMVPFVAGASRVGYPQFLAYNVLGGVSWAIWSVSIGYLAGQSWHVVEHWLGRASAILGVVVIMVLVLVLFGRWAVRHEVELKAWWASIHGRPWVAAIVRRLRPLATFVRARLTPGETFGLQLTAGIVVLVAAAWLFGLITQNVLNGNPLTDWDEAIAEWFQAHSTRSATAIMQLVAALGGPIVVSVVGTLTALVLLATRDLHRLLGFLFAVPGGLLINALLKSIFQLGGPSWEDTLKYSYPSGHTIAAVLLYGVLLVYAVQSTTSWRRRVIRAIATALVILLVGVATMYLRNDYLSDVLAALAEGVAWLALSLTAVGALRRARAGLL